MGQVNIVPGGPYSITWTWLRGLVYLTAQVDQICRGTGGPNGPGKPGGLDGPAVEWTFDYTAWQPGGTYSIKWTRLKGYR